jgi:hypothetical protein
MPQMSTLVIGLKAIHGVQHGKGVVYPSARASLLNPRIGGSSGMRSGTGSSNRHPLVTLRETQLPKMLSGKTNVS